MKCRHWAPIGCLLIAMNSLCVDASALGTISSVDVVNRGGAQTLVPVTFGQVFAPGDVPASASLAAALGSGATIPLQVDAKATHADGSLRHAVISAVLPSLASHQVETLGLSSAPAGASPSLTPASLLAEGFSARVDVSLDGVTYTK